YMFAEWDIKYLEDPEGIYGEDESIITIVREDLEDEMPEAYQILDELYWDVSDVEEALLKAEENDIEDVAQEWVDENQETVAEWTEGIEPVNGTPFELSLTPWDAEEFTTHVTKVILDEQGYDVTLTPVDPAVLFEAIASGESDAS